MSELAKKMLKKLYEETLLSGVREYPVSIADLQEEFNNKDIELRSAITFLLQKGLISYRGISNDMIQLTEKGKQVFK
jgi:hypothetical protein